VAAVLLLIYPRAGIPHIVFTQRTETVARHQGQISLPGGSRDPGDPTIQATALRETEEEIGIPAADVDLWGRVGEDVYVQVSDFIITPFIGSIAYEPSFRVSPGEVAHVIEVPVDVLRDPAIFREEDRILHGNMRRIEVYEYGPHEIWGATARVIQLFLASPFAERASRWTPERSVWPAGTYPS
jgi:8-oxo-dGTP pyrophosphatase MutT (NUDIX family)